MLLIDPDTGDILDANRAAVGFYGYNKETLTAMRIHDINTLNQEKIEKEMSLAKAEKRNYYDFIHQLACGECREVEVQMAPIDTEKGTFLLSIINDAAHKSYQKLMYDTLFYYSPYAVALLDEEQKVIKSNDNFTSLFQYEAEELIGQSLSHMVSSAENINQIDQNIKMIYEGMVVKQEGKRRRKDGSLIDVEIMCYPVIHHNSILGAYIIYIDISKKIHMLQRDSLTGLYNRSSCISKMNQLMGQSTADKGNFAVLYIGIGGLEDINHSLGHHYGEELLVELSTRLLDQMDTEDQLFRFSDDTFIILYEGYQDREQLDRLTETLLYKIRSPYTIEQSILYITASIGICFYPKHGQNAELLIQHADMAMNKARRQLEENICYYSEDMSREFERRFTIANYLARAIMNQEFYLCYQPIYSLDCQDTLVSAEALLRWKSPVLGNVTPDEFIGLAERTGHILSIGDWVLENVCKNLWLWRQKAYSLVPISINISVKQLEQRDFYHKVLMMLKRYQLEPTHIELEITESVSSGEVGTIVNNLRELKKAGIKISMDDFGKGFSSLGQIERYELDKLKIDKDFIKDIVWTIRKQNLVRSIIAMAKGMDLIVVAEGIETPEQLNYLKDSGCPMGQGYLLSRPLLQADFEEKLFHKT